MNKYILLGLIFMGLSCHKTDTNIKNGRHIPSFKGFWQIKNEYPFWNPSHLRQTGCITTGTNYYLYIDSISTTQYTVYKGFADGTGYYLGVRAAMQFDTLSNQIYIQYGSDSVYSNPFRNFYTMKMSYDTTSKEIKGFVGEMSLWDCINQPGDAFQGNTIWWKQP